MAVVANQAVAFHKSYGFNEGWIDFESGEANSRKKRTTLEAVLRSLVTSNPNS
jgi:hypothetical protein